MAKKSKLKKFTAFVDGLYPSEVEYIKRNNIYQDEELFDILNRIESRINRFVGDITFNEDIDPRKYTKLIKNFDHKLSKVDVDAYYGWISEINHRISVDEVTPSDQNILFKELSVFQPTWFHASAFYETLINYRNYLLLRFRQKEYQAVCDFLEKHEEHIQSDLKINERIRSHTKTVVIQKEDLQKVDLLWLEDIFMDDSVCKKTRYQALITLLICHINQKRIEAMIGPMEFIEKRLFEGEFYSRRILANFYANKLLMLNYLGKYEEAAFCGKQSIKHPTQDYLYYLNNYCSVLMHLKKNNEAFELMKSAFTLYKESRDTNRRVVFMANYCRILNRNKEYNKTVRYSKNLLDEIGENIFQSKWNYFFRIFFDALLKTSQSYRLLRLERKYNLVERERQEMHVPYLSVLKLGAGFQDLKISEDFFKRELASIKSNISELEKNEMSYFLNEIERT